MLKEKRLAKEKWDRRRNQTEEIWEYIWVEER